MESATLISVTFAVILIAITGLAVYTSFGPPSTQLQDPFDDHED